MQMEKGRPFETVVTVGLLAFPWRTDKVEFSFDNVASWKRRGLKGLEKVIKFLLLSGKT